MTTQSHESLTSFRKVSASSDRKFGMTVGAVFLLIAVWPVLRHHAPVRPWLLLIGAALLGFGLVAPKLLAPLNKLWAQLGLLLAKVTNPIVMGLMYFLALVPFAYLLRAQGKDLLRLKRDPSSQSYWIERDESARTS